MAENSSNLTKGGGEPNVKPIDYKPPVGPTNINDPKGPGLHGENHGNCGSQGGGRSA